VVKDLASSVWGFDSKTVYVSGKSALDGGEEKFFRVDVSTGNLKAFAYDQSVSITEPFLSATGQHLFFRNTQDGNRLYYLDLSGIGR